MNKLTIEIMTDLYNSADDHLDTISERQLKHFKKAMDGDDTAPAYMIKFCQNYKPLTGGVMHDLKAEKVTGKTFVITSAQNNTDVHTKFLASIQQFCTHNNAELLIAGYIYDKNSYLKTHKHKGMAVPDNEIYYDTALTPFLSNELKMLEHDLFFAGNLNILPTAKFPLNGFENYQGINSCIIPTSKIALQSVPVMKGDNVKFLYGTGTVTLKNYIQKKVGQVAESQHNYGACIVTIDEKGVWFVRQIETDHTGVFQDLTITYYPDRVEQDTPILAITFGDFHAEKMDFGQLDICKWMVEDLSPEDVFIHDLFDMSTRNHHNKQSGHFLHKMNEMNFSVQGDLDISINVLNGFYGFNTNINIVESNHDQALEKWLDDPAYNYRTDPENAQIFLELQLAMYENITDGNFMILEHALKKDGALEVSPNFLQVDDSFKVAGVECGVHGHIGTNGSRGNPKQFQKLNQKMNTGHTHQCSIYGNVYTSGVTGSLEMGYNKGAGSWSHSHTLIYKTGFRTIITTKKGRYW